MVEKEEVGEEEEEDIHQDRMAQLTVGLTGSDTRSYRYTKDPQKVPQCPSKWSHEAY